MKKAVILDGYTLNPGDLDWTPLKNLADFTIYDRTSYSLDDLELIVERSKDAEMILTNKTPISREIIEQLPQLKYIGVLATGYNIVDIEAAKEHGVVVTNIPAYSTNAVAQFSIAFLLELCHRIGSHSDAVRRGDWSKSEDFAFWNHPLIELDGKTIGIVGYGSIGQATAKVAQALGMNVLGYRRNPDKSMETDKMKFASLDELFAKSDVISLHTPLTEDTKGMINKDSIGKMKDNVLIINTARGPLINDEDLAEALNQGKVGGAAIDVATVEPINADNPLLQAKNCIITPHIAWATKEARERLLNIQADNIRMFLEGNPINVVNK